MNPNEARALVLFGRYAGSLKSQGFWWVNPFTRRPRISIKVRNFESQKLKVNDHDGNPIEIAAVVVWRVEDTAEALFEVDDYEEFLKVQTEAAIRTLTTSYPYEPHSRRAVAARQPPRGRPAAADGGPGPPAEGRHRGDGHPHQPPRLRPRDRQRDAAAPAGRARSSTLARGSSRAR